MQRNEQAAFVRELSESVIERIVKCIEAGHVPAEWDGIQLRRYIADKFQEQAVDRMMSKAERKEYNRQLAMIAAL